ncbi:sensor histidine kinase [Scleromatobacter humisilvae]|uniref:histidine kinase n=1 Tax=Scleromatobacter humisilvae TaxID=2897159 RepID=A0A9X1YLG2_9BURK|nr:HAMP domain-containing sensor histidine kinase [Scleromatobacter humisilvae]MCK9688484.1 HAMP domain-containing histidine kinase [Scleromatobacter humisilvae]
MSNFLRLSFRQTLLAAFLLIAGLLAAASLGGLFTLERVMAQSRVATASALLLTADARQLAELRVAMERSARQYIVLDDPSLLRGFTQAGDDATRLLGEMGRHDLPQQLSTQWLAQIQPIKDELGGPKASIQQREDALDQSFRTLDRLNAQIAEAVRRLDDERSAALQAQLEAGRASVGTQVLGAIVLAAMLALAFGVWLTRPLKRLERAIAGLGENRMDAPVDIRGPSDLRSLGRRLEWLRLRLKELDEDKARFLRYTSHELKTPLAALREGVALLEDGVAGPMTADQREIARILGHNTATLQNQIEALLRFNAAAFEARRLNRSETDLRTLLHGLVEEQRLQWQARHLTIELNGEAPVLAVDADKLSAALGNLLSNSIRFSPVAGKLFLTLSSSPGKVRIDLQDQGPGVAPADRERIFEPFFRGEVQPDGAVRGTGIGLSIVREYIQAHGGRVDLLSDGPGAHFRIELPHVSD